MKGQRTPSRLVLRHPSGHCGPIGVPSSILHVPRQYFVSDSTSRHGTCSNHTFSKTRNVFYLHTFHESCDDYIHWPFLDSRHCHYHYYYYYNNNNNIPRFSWFVGRRISRCSDSYERRENPSTVHNNYPGTTGDYSRPKTVEDQT